MQVLPPQWETSCNSCNANAVVSLAAVSKPLVVLIDPIRMPRGEERRGEERRGEKRREEKRREEKNRM